MRISILLAIVATLLLAISTSHAAPTVSINAATPVQLSYDADTNVLQVESTAIDWKIKLQSTSILGSSAAVQQALYDIPTFYRGTIANDEDSWVRLNGDSPISNSTESNLLSAALHGHIFFKNYLYKLRHDSMHGYFLMPLEHTKLGTGTSTTALINKNLPDITPSSILDSKTPKAIKIGIVVDSRFNERYNGRGLAEALSIINGVDGMFQAQMGLSIIVERFRLIEDAETDPLRSFPGSMEEILYRFRTHRIQDSELPANLALVHLFTGHSNPNELIGLSWIDTVCQADGYDVSVSSPFPYSMLLSAHEIAHNLGAVHDNDPQCLADEAISGNEVMWSELSHSTQAKFSSCSIERMEQSLSSSCVVDNIDVAVALKSEATGKALEQRIEISAMNLDAFRSVKELSSTTEFPLSVTLSNASAGCSINGNLLTCQHSEIGALQQSALSVIAQFSKSDPTIVSSQITSYDFTDTNRADNQATISINFNGVANSQSAIAFAETANEDSVQNRTGGAASAGSFSPIGVLLLCLILCSSIVRVRVRSI